MLSSDDIANLKSQGMSDDDILSGVQKIAPHTSDDIAKLKKEGVSSDFILQHLDKFKEPTAPTMGPVDAAIDLAKGVVHGAGAELKAIGATNDAISGGPPGKLSNAAGFVQGAVDDYIPSKFDVTKLSTYGEIPKTLAETAPGLGAAVGVGSGLGSFVPGVGTVAGGMIAAGGYGAYKSLGAIANMIAKNNGHAEPTTKDLVQALPGAAASGVIQGTGLGAGGLLGKVGASSVLGRMIQAGGANAIAGGLDSATQQAAGSLGTEHGLDVSGHEVANAAANAGLAGAFHSGLQSGGEARVDKRYAKFENDHAKALADEMVKAHGGSTEEKFTNAVGNTEISLKNAIKPMSDADLVASGYTKTKPGPNGTTKVLGDKSVNQIPQSVEEARAALKNGTVLDRGVIDELKNDLANHHSGNEVADLLGRLNEANKLKQGTGSLEQALTDMGYVGHGGFNIISKDALGGSVGSALFAAALGHNPLYGAAYLAKPYVLKYGARAIDGIMGTDNPLQRFQDRFSGQQRLQGTPTRLAPQPPPPPPAQPWGPVAPPPTTGTVPAMPGPQGPSIPPLAMAQIRALQMARQQAQAQQATPVAPAPPAPVPEAPSLPTEPMQISASDPTSGAALLELLQSGVSVGAAGGTKPTKPTKASKEAKVTAALALAKLQSAQAGTSAPEAPNVHDLIPIEHSEGVRMQPKSEIKTTIDNIKNGIEINNSAKRAAYDTPVEGLSASEQSQWSKMTEKDGPFRSHFNQDGMGGHGKAHMEAHVKDMLNAHGLKSHTAHNKIVRHLEKHHWFKTFGHKKKHK